MITYPVAENTRWDFWDTNLGDFASQGVPWPKKGGAELNLDANIIPLLRVDADIPPTTETQGYRPIPLRTVDLDANTSTREWEVYDLPPEDVKEKQISAGREGMRAQWDSFDPHLRGPYRKEFEATNLLLDEKDYDAAIALITALVPTPVIEADADLLDEFNTVKAGFVTGIGGLKTINEQ